MTKPFSMALKQQMVARLTGVNALSAAQLARETGITQQNLSRWLCEARIRPCQAAGMEIVSSRTLEQKAGIIVQAGQLHGDELIAYLKMEGVKTSHFRHWRQALEEAGEEFAGMTKRIHQLERELVRKERALAEAATLLIRRNTLDGLIQQQDDGIDEQVEKELELNC